MSRTAAVICPKQDCRFFSQSLWPRSSLIVLLLASYCSNTNCSSLLSRPLLFVVPHSLPRCGFLSPLGSVFCFFTMSAIVSVAFGKSVTMKFCEATLLASQNSSLLGQLWRAWRLVDCSWSRQCWSLFPSCFEQVFKVQISCGPWSDQGEVPSGLGFLYVIKTEKLSNYSWKKPTDGEVSVWFAFYGYSCAFPDASVALSWGTTLWTTDLSVCMWLMIK